jgi:Ca2+-binding EF-hand superfamily protein
VENGMAAFMEPEGTHRPLSGDDIAELHDEFQACDTDGDGQVGISEFESLLQSVGSQLSSEQRRSEFLRIDADGNGLIDLAEFKRWWLGS